MLNISYLGTTHKYCISPGGTGGKYVPRPATRRVFFDQMDICHRDFLLLSQSKFRPKYRPSIFDFSRKSAGEPVQWVLRTPRSCVFSSCITFPYPLFHVISKLHVIGYFSMSRRISQRCTQSFGLRVVLKLREIGDTLQQTLSLPVKN